jgi:predicted CXXCH cytochrome family protein
MIRCLLVQITRNRHGQPIRTERRIAADTLRIGRSAECAIHLPDHRVRPHHAAIRDAEDGKFYIEGEAERIDLDGQLHQVAELKPGTRVPIGPYELVAEATGDGELVVSLELIHPRPPETAILERAPATLAAAGWSRHRPAIWLASLIGLLFLLLPLLQATSPPIRQALASLPLTPEQAWNPGPLLPGHRSFATQCDQCHRQPFEAVSDQACQSCHRATTPHASAASAGELRCAECHRDHKGSDGLVRDDGPLCVSCHEEFKQRNASLALANVHSFETDHPAFRLSFKPRPGEEHPRRVLQSENARLTEETGLRFSHEVHAGRLRYPSDPQKIRVMDCADCHRPDSAGVRFAPVTMREHCFDCHKEEFDFNPPQGGRRLPHGPESAVMDALENFYLRKALTEDTPRGGRAAAGKVPVQQALETAAARARKAATALAGDIGCGLCHETRAAGGTAPMPWTIQAVTVTDHWLPAARFSHDKHRVSKCTVCHDVSRSRRSADVAIPDIGTCRRCHAGERPAGRRIASPCASCHRFHQSVAALTGPASGDPPR